MSNEHLDKEKMISALVRAIEDSGVEVIKNKDLLRSLLGDLLSGVQYKVERKTLIDVTECNSWHSIIDVDHKNEYEKERVLSVISTELHQENGLSKERIGLVLDCYTTALGWGDVKTSLLTDNNVRATDDTTTNKTNNETKSDNSTTNKSITETIDSLLNAAPPIGSLYKFASDQWIVLDVQADKMLLIAKDVVKVNIAFSKDKMSSDWSASSLRNWLNTSYLSTFNSLDKAQIVETTIGNSGFANTTDKIYILSLAEVQKYLGKNGRLQTNNSEMWIDDQYNSNRIAYHHREPAYWWLRTSGYCEQFVSYISPEGKIRPYGFFATHDGRLSGVRPALWVNLNSSN
jgi:hypothetical protein